MNENANRKTALSALGVVLFMGSMAWASVPLYDLFLPSYRLWWLY